MAEVWDDALAAWVEYLNEHDPSPECIENTRLGFLAGWRAARAREDKQNEKNRRY